MKTVFSKGKTRYRRVHHAGFNQVGVPWPYFWLRDRRQLLHKGKKP